MPGVMMIRERTRERQVILGKMWLHSGMLVLIKMTKAELISLLDGNRQTEGVVEK